MKTFKLFGLIIHFLMSLKLKPSETSENITFNLKKLRAPIEKILVANK